MEGGTGALFEELAAAVAAAEKESGAGFSGFVAVVDTVVVIALETAGAVVGFTADVTFAADLALEYDIVPELDSFTLVALVVDAATVNVGVFLLPGAATAAAADEYDITEGLVTLATEAAAGVAAVVAAVEYDTVVAAAGLTV